MASPVICPGCTSRFTVSDKFAGMTGPCPKCKRPIKIPAITIHEPEAPRASSGGTGRVPTAPLPRFDRPVPQSAILASGAGAVALLVAAWLVGLVVKPGDLPAWLLLGLAFVVAVPCVMLGYEAIRDRDLEPYRGRPFLIRSLGCAAIYAGLWALKGLLPPEATSEMWQWTYLGPMFGAAGAIAALATLDVEWGPAVALFGFYAMFTVLLRWLMGMPPV
jgi:hypothetical protein